MPLDMEGIVSRGRCKALAEIKDHLDKNGWELRRKSTGILTYRKIGPPLGHHAALYLYNIDTNFTGEWSLFVYNGKKLIHESNDKFGLPELKNVLKQLTKPGKNRCL